ncbi:MAG: sugar phosphate isomerase/epimerase family protein [Chloroflexota bacterium]
MDQASRFTFSSPGSWPLERSVEWAKEHGFSRVDFNADGAPNYPGSFSADRMNELRGRAESSGITLGIHTLSAVNMAEITPVMAAAADQYLQENFDLAASLGCGYLVCHGGFHFSTDYDARFEASLARAELMVHLAEERNLDVYFENHNWEPEHAEIHYVPHNVVETRRYFERFTSPRFKWACNIGHAALVPDNWTGFLDAFGTARIGHVRLHDTHGQYEEHLLPGRGILDFRAIFTRLRDDGYTGPFTLDFGSPDDRARGMDEFARLLEQLDG